MILLVVFGTAFGAAQTASSPTTEASRVAPVVTLPEKAMTTVADAIRILQDQQDFKKLAKRRPHGPLGNPGQFFGTDNYPAAALRAGEQGRVAAQLSIGIDGKVTDCVIETSSGSRSLDDATCAIALHRVTYIPAVDQRGKPIASTTPIAVRWVLPHNGPTIPPNMTVSIQITVATDGTVQSCESEPAVPVAMGNPCAIWSVGRRVMAPPTREGRPVKAHVAITTDIVTVLDP